MHRPSSFTLCIYDFAMVSVLLLYTRRRERIFIAVTSLWFQVPKHFCFYSVFSVRHGRCAPRLRHKCRMERAKNVTLRTLSWTNRNEEQTKDHYSAAYRTEQLVAMILERKHAKCMWICSHNTYSHVIVQLNVTVHLLWRPKAFVMLTTFV